MKKDIIKKSLLKGTTITLIIVACCGLYGGSLYHYKNVVRKACTSQSEKTEDLIREQLKDYIDICNLEVTIDTQLEKTDYTLTSMNLITQINLDSYERHYNLKLESFYSGFIRYFKNEKKMKSASINKDFETEMARILVCLEQDKQEELIEEKMSNYTEHELTARRLAQKNIAKKLEVKEEDLVFDDNGLSISHYNPINSSMLPNGIIVEERFCKGNTKYSACVMLKFNKDYSRYKIADYSIYQY